MKRLTGWDGDRAYISGLKPFEMPVDEEAKIRAVVERLAAYEDIGIEPNTLVDEIPAADVRPVPPGGIGNMSDGYHTFNGLYHQRLVLFAALVRAYRDRAWKSHRHEDGDLCFGGGWFIVGIDTPEGGYTYHYEDKDWDLFDCEELPVGKHWDGHTEDDVTRLFSLPKSRPVVRGEWVYEEPNSANSFNGCYWCDQCHQPIDRKNNFCPNCGADMRKEDETDV